VEQCETTTEAAKERIVRKLLLEIWKLREDDGTYRVDDESMSIIIAAAFTAGRLHHGCEMLGDFKAWVDYMNY
jgi:hypothetical protein